MLPSSRRHTLRFTMALPPAAPLRVVGPLLPASTHQKLSSTAFCCSPILPAASTCCAPLAHDSTELQDMFHDAAVPRATLLPMLLCYGRALLWQGVHTCQLAGSGTGAPQNVPFIDQTCRPAWVAAAPMAATASIVTPVPGERLHMHPGYPNCLESSSILPKHARQLELRRGVAAGSIAAAGFAELANHGMVWQQPVTSPSS